MLFVNVCVFFQYVYVFISVCVCFSYTCVFIVNSRFLYENAKEGRVKKTCRGRHMEKERTSQKTNGAALLVPSQRQFYNTNVGELQWFEHIFVMATIYETKNFNEEKTKSAKITKSEKTKSIKTREISFFLWFSPIFRQLFSLFCFLLITLEKIYTAD